MNIESLIPELENLLTLAFDAWVEDEFDDADDELREMAQSVVDKVKDMNGRFGDWYIKNLKHKPTHLMDKTYEFVETTVRNVDNISIYTITIYHVNGEIDAIEFDRFSNTSIDDFLWALENYPEKAPTMFGKVNLEKIAELLKGIINGKRT